MNIITVTFEYRVTREVEIITDENLTDAEIEARARKADIEITENMPATTTAFRRVLRASPCNIAIRRETDDFNIETAKAIISILNVQKCFAPDGRLGTYPKWVKFVMIERMVSLGLFRRAPGNSSNYMDTQYYLVESK